MTVHSTITIHTKDSDEPAVGHKVFDSLQEAAAELLGVFMQIGEYPDGDVTKITLEFEEVADKKGVKN